MDLSPQEKADRIRQWIHSRNPKGDRVMTMLRADGGPRTSMFMVCLAMDDPKDYPILLSRLERAIATLKLIGE